MSEKQNGDAPKLRIDDESLIDAIAKRAEHLESQALSAAGFAFKNLEEMGEKLDQAYSKLAVTASAALYCLEHNYGLREYNAIEKKLSLEE